MSTDPFPWWYTRKSHDAWSTLRARGAWRFVLVNGVAVYGGLMFVFAGVLAPYIRGAIPDYAGSAAIWATAGFAWGALIWQFSERNFRKFATFRTNES